MSIKVKLLKEQEWKQQKRIFLASPDYPSWLWQSDHVVNIWPNIPDTGSRKTKWKEWKIMEKPELSMLHEGTKAELLEANHVWSKRAVLKW